MRFGLALLLALGMSALAFSPSMAQDEKIEKRFGLLLEAEVYPQTTPKELQASILKVLKRERYDYLVAHMMEPTFVDQRLQSTRTTAEQLGKEIKGKFEAQPELLKDLNKLLLDGEMTDAGTKATLKHKDVKNQQVFMKKVGERWYVENRMKEEKSAEKE